MSLIEIISAQSQWAKSLKCLIYLTSDLLPVMWLLIFNSWRIYTTQRVNCSENAPLLLLPVPLLLLIGVGCGCQWKGGGDIYVKFNKEAKQSQLNEVQKSLLIWIHKTLHSSRVLFAWTQHSASDCLKPNTKTEEDLMVDQVDSWSRPVIKYRVARYA